MAHDDADDGDHDVLRALPAFLVDDGDDEDIPELNADPLNPDKPMKKHSGPRKRRPKKKKADKPTEAEALARQPRTQAKRELSIDTSVMCPVQPASEDAAVTLKVLRATAAPFVPVSPSPPSTLLPFPLGQLGSPLEELNLSGSVGLPSPPLLPTGQPFQYSRSPPPLHGLRSDTDQYDREYWTQYVIEAAEKERARRLNVLRQLQEEEAEEIRRRRAWAIAAIEQEQQAMMREMFLDNMKNTQWFQSTITRLDHDYEVVCPNSWFGCTFSCMLKDLEAHLENCVYRQVPDTLDQVVDETMAMDLYSYDVVCPNAMLGCSAIFPREELANHLATCAVSAMTREKEWQERQEWQQNVIEMTEEERQRRMEEHRDEQEKFSFGHLQKLYDEQTAMMHVVLHDEIVQFTNECQAEASRLRPTIELAIERLRKEIHAIWGSDTLVESYGSFATNLHGDHSDVDLVVFGATQAEAPAMTSQECVSKLATHLSHLTDGTVSDISAITRASIPLAKVVMNVHINSDEETAVNPSVVRIPFDITFDDPRDSIHNGVASATLLHILMEHFYGLRELTLVLKHFLATRGLSDPYVGGLSSYGLKLMIIYILREQGALVPQSSSANGDTIGDLEVVDHDTVSMHNPNQLRLDAQKRKGIALAREIVGQARARQTTLMSGALKDTGRRKRRSETQAWEFFVNAPPLEAQAASRSSPHTAHHNKPFLLGKLLMDFLQWYGNDFRHNLDQVSVLTIQDGLSVFEYPTSAKSPTMISATNTSPPPTQRVASGPPSLSPIITPFQTNGHDSFLVIHDPLQRNNNVGKTCYRISQVLRDFSDFLSVLTALIVRGSVLPTSSPGSPEGSAGPSASHRILSSVFQMKQATASIMSNSSASTSSPTLIHGANKSSP